MTYTRHSHLTKPYKPPAILWNPSLTYKTAGTAVITYLRPYFTLIIPN